MSDDEHVECQRHADRLQAEATYWRAAALRIEREWWDQEGPGGTFVSALGWPVVES